MSLKEKKTEFGSLESFSVEENLSLSEMKKRYSVPKKRNRFLNTDIPTDKKQRRTSVPEGSLVPQKSMRKREKDQ